MSLEPLDNLLGSPDQIEKVDINAIEKRPKGLKVIALRLIGGAIDFDGIEGCLINPA
jgi:hypothetical protein